MRFSSYWGPRSTAIAYACLAALLSGSSYAAVAGRAGPGVARMTAMPRPQPRTLPAVRAGDFGRQAAGRRLRRGYGYGVAGLGLGLAGYGLDAGDGLDGGYGPQPPIGPDAPLLPPPVFLPVPPACPLIIRVGRGLAHPVRTQVVYGRPVCRR